jgi:hypothetical protein
MSYKRREAKTALAKMADILLRGVTKSKTIKSNLFDDHAEKREAMEYISTRVSS